MKTVTLSDGRELTIDLYKVTIAEWRAIFEVGQAQDEEDEIVGRILGLTAEELRGLSQPDYRRALKAMLEAGAGPLEDPNSQSASTEASQDKAESQANTGDGN